MIDHDRDKLTPFSKYLPESTGQTLVHQIELQEFFFCSAIR